MFSALRNGRKGFIAKLIHTVKDHKPKGKVVFRAIHGCAQHCFKPLALWLNTIIEAVISKFKFILNSSDEFIEFLKINPIENIPGENSFLIHADIDDFFMIGKQRFHIHHICMMVGKNIRSHFASALDFLLEHQYIDAGTIDGVVYKCISGTGQGLTHSKAVAVATFLHSQELCGASLAKNNEAYDFYY